MTGSIPAVPRPSDGRISRRAVLRGGLAGAGALAVGPLLWSRPGWAATSPPAGLHLTYGADPTRSVAVSWSTPGSVARPVLEVGLDPELGLTVEAETRGLAATPTAYHHGLIGALSPGTTYHYPVRHDGTDGLTGTFRTSAATAVPFRFATFGDMGVTDAAASVVRRVMAAAPDLVFVAGDLCYADKTGLGLPVRLPVLVDETAWDDWLTLISPSAAANPWMTVVGNHEMEADRGELGYDGYLARFTLPASAAPGTATTWSMRYGTVGFVALDANDVSYEITRNTGYAGPAQDRWLRATLAALRSDPAVDFIVVGFHHCAYCTNLVHASDGGVRDRWVAIYDEFAVDLVVNGHNHSYERTHPLRGGAPVVEVTSGGVAEPATHGTVYVTAGGGGQNAYPTTLHTISFFTDGHGLRVPETAPWSAVRFMNHSLVVVDVTPAGDDRMRRPTAPSSTGSRWCVGDRRRA
ncbi:MAG: fibronectin type III domain-containing protein [Acidimicrobiales bacterium]